MEALLVDALLFIAACAAVIGAFVSAYPVLTVAIAAAAILLLLTIMWRRGARGGW